MNNAPACLKRAAECTRLAEATSDPEMKVYLLKLGLSWMQAATAARRDEPLLEEGHSLAMPNTLGPVVASGFGLFARDPSGACF